MRRTLNLILTRDATKGGALALSLAVFWFLPSCYAVLSSDPELFQRLGALAMVWAICVFTIGRGHLAEFGGLVSKAEKMSNSVPTDLDRLLADICELEAQKHRSIETSKGMELEYQTYETKLADQLESIKGRIKTVNEDASTLTEILPSARRTLNFVTLFEAWIFCIGTVQSSFGDWFFCSISTWSLSRC